MVSNMKVTGDSSSDGVVGVRVCLKRFKRDQEERNPVVACRYTDEKDLAERDILK